MVAKYIPCLIFSIEILTLTEGEDEFRLNGPLISVNEWDHIMQQTGFSGVDLELPDYLDQSSHEYSLIISTAVEPQVDLRLNSLNNGVRFPKTLIISIEDSSTQQRLARRIRDHLLSTGGTDCNIATLEQASEAVDLHERFCFFFTEVEEPFLADVSSSAFAMLQYIITRAPGILWTTNSASGASGSLSTINPHKSLIEGLPRVARTEFNRLVFVTLALERAFVEPNSAANSDNPASKVIQVFEEILVQSDEDYESEYRERNGMLQIGRVIEARDLNQAIHAKVSSHQHRFTEFGSSPPLALHIASPGLLNSMQFLEDFNALEPLGAGEVEIEVEAVGVNFPDCLIALGQLDSKSLGYECSGVVSRVGTDCDLKSGERVAALFTNTYRTFARGPAHCVVKIPNEMAFAEASALTVVFFTAWYGLCEVGRLQRGESVLIHAVSHLFRPFIPLFVKFWEPEI